MKTNDEYHRLANKLVLLNRAKKKVEDMQKDVRGQVLKEMVLRKVTELEVKKGKVKRVPSKKTILDVLKLIKRHGLKAVAEMLSASVKAAKEKFGADGLKGIMREEDGPDSVRTYPTKKPDKAVVRV